MQFFCGFHCCCLFIYFLACLLDVFSMFAFEFQMWFSEDFHLNNFRNSNRTDGSKTTHQWCVWEISFWPLFDFPVPSHSRATNSFTMWERIKKYSTRVKRMGERVGKSVKARACENNYLIHSRICWVFCSYAVFFFFVCAECLSCFRSVCVRACVCVLYSLYKNTLTLRHKMAYLLLHVVSRTRKT